MTTKRKSIKLINKEQSISNEELLSQLNILHFKLKMPNVTPNQREFLLSEVANINKKLEEFFEASKKK